MNSWNTRVFLLEAVLMVAGTGGRNTCFAIYSLFHTFDSINACVKFCHCCPWHPLYLLHSICWSVTDGSAGCIIAAIMSHRPLPLDIFSHRLLLHPVISTKSSVIFLRSQCSLSNIRPPVLLDLETFWVPCCVLYRNTTIWPTCYVFKVLREGTIEQSSQKVERGFKHNIISALFWQHHSGVTFYFLNNMKASK